MRSSGSMLANFCLFLLLYLMEQHLLFTNASIISQLKNPTHNSNQPQAAQLSASLPPGQAQQHQQQQHQLEHHLEQSKRQSTPHSYLHEKDSMLDVIKRFNSDPDSELHDSYQALGELKHSESHPAIQTFPWNFYNPPQTHTTSPHAFDRFGPMSTPKFLPFVGYPQPVFIPYPLFFASDLMYSAFPAAINNDYEDTMSRTPNGHHSNTAAINNNNALPRNSPIYYMRLPPTPYVFLPNLGYPGSQTTANLPSVFPYTTLPPNYSAFSPVFNLPINFLTNGKPSNIYQMSSSPNDIQNSLHYSGINHFGHRPNPLQSNTFPARDDPDINYFPRPLPYRISAPSPLLPAPQQDSKLTALKRPYFFNGRPEEIYILPNNLNSIYSEHAYY